MPITGTIFDIKQFALYDGPGIRTTVFFKGCPLDCNWCHNPESRCPVPEDIPLHASSAGDRSDTQTIKTIGTVVTPEEILDKIRQDEIFYDESSGGVTFSGGEPMMQIEFLEELLNLCVNEGYHTAVDTSGYTEWESFERVLKLVDLFLYDLKPMDDTVHLKYTAVSNKLIHDNLRKLSQTDTALVVRIPLIPEITDTETNLNAAAKFVKSLSTVTRIDLLPYNIYGHDKIDRYKLKRTKPDWQTQSTDKIESAKKILTGFGFDVRIGS